MTCGDSVGSYDIELHNGTKQLIDDAHVSFGKFKSIGGSIPPGISKQHMEVNRTLPDTATVEWRTADGVLHHKDVALKSAVGEHFSGVINVEIGDNEQVRVWGSPR